MKPSFPALPDDLLGYRDYAIRVVVSGDENDPKATVYISGPDGDITYWMCATEFLIHTVARMSSAGYEKAMEQLCNGATSYKVPPDYREDRYECN